MSIVKLAPVYQLAVRSGTMYKQSDVSRWWQGLFSIDHCWLLHLNFFLARTTSRDLEEFCWGRKVLLTTCCCWWQVQHYGRVAILFIAVTSTALITALAQCK